MKRRSLRSIAEARVRLRLGLAAVLTLLATSSAVATDLYSTKARPGTVKPLAGVAGYFTLPPCRVMDTRVTSGVPITNFGFPLRGQSTLTPNVRGACGLPGNAIAVSYNATVTAPTGAGNLRLFPGGASLPGTSAINYGVGQTRANNGVLLVSTDGTVNVYVDQPVSTTTHVILDVNGYFVTTDNVATPAGQAVVVRAAPEVEITFDTVSTPGVTSAHVLDFVDNRTGAVDQNLKNFFPVGSPEQALVPSIIVPSFIVPLGKGGPAGPPTFVLSLMDTTAAFSRTAEFHGLEDFRLGWDPPCSNSTDRTQEPRTFYAREATEPNIVEEAGYSGQPVFVDISSGCGSNKGSGWSFSAYLTAKDTRSPHAIALYMLNQMQAAVTQLSNFMGAGATAIGNEITAALGTLDTTPSSSITNMDNIVAYVDGNAGQFTNTTRNVSGEFVGRALSARYMLRKLVGFDVYTVPEAFMGALGALDPTTLTFDNLTADQSLPIGSVLTKFSRNGVLSQTTLNVSASGFPGVATPAWLAVSQPQTLAVDRTGCSSSHTGCSFFFPGDSVALHFDNPVRAVGAYFSVNAGAASLQEFITITTPVGVAKSHNPLPAGTAGFPAFTLRFVGLVSDVPFSDATFSTATFGMVIDDITYAR